MDKKPPQTPPFPLPNGPTQSEHIKTLEKELLELLRQKQKIDKRIVDVEYKLYQLEGSYFEETASTGNILKGFDGYQGVRTDRKKLKGFVPEDRIFSLSSSTYQQSLETKKLELEYESTERASTTPNTTYSSMQPPTKKKKYSPSSTNSTPTSSVPSTPSTSIKKRGQGQKRSTRVSALAEGD